MAVSQRHRELALVRLAGATPRQALAMVRNEAIATTLIALAFGAAVAAAAGLGVARAYPGGHLAVVPLIAGAIVATAALVGVGSATVATRVALRRPPRPTG
jgi:putative ABC transport system permease protein